MSPTAVTDVANKLYEFIRRAPTVRKFSAPILQSNIEDGRHPVRTFERDRAYFQLRLSEMFLRNGRELWREFMPMTVFITEFIFDGKQQTVPFVVNNDILNSIQKYVEGNSIEYRNTKVAGPIPYCGGDISLFTGLYRTKINDLSVGFFSFIGGLVQAFDASGLTRYLDVARPLGAGLTSLLGMKDVEFCLGTRDELSEQKTFSEGYWVYVNAAEKSIAQDRLWVKGDQLFVGERNSVKRFDQSDYCLVQLEYLEERGDYTTLAFHRSWVQAKELIWNNEPEKAKVKFAQLAQELAVSPDLTRRHRFALMQVYKANFESEVEAFRSLTLDGPAAGGEPRRGQSGHLRATDAILEQYAMLEKTSLPKNAIASMYHLSKNWQKIHAVHDRGREFSLTDEIISTQLSDIQEIAPITDPQPEELAKAMTIAAFAA
jgi:hypothetical protein